MTTNAIEVKNLSKKFHLWHGKESSLKSTVVNLLRGGGLRREEFWALKDIDFKVKKGETLGIIGPNGSGKTTLLKILAGILYPTKGEVKVNGRVSTLFELGTGFHPELNGRENIFLNGAILGLSRRELRKKFNQIVEFSELEKFIEMPLKHYSSGMQVRLAFSVAINVEPDILLVDEVFAVGDANFQKKCLEVFNSFKRKGVTIAFVSHDLGTISSYCDRAIFLDKGKVMAAGRADEVALAYEAQSREEFEKKAEKGGREDVRPEDKDRWGSGEIEMTDVKFLNAKGGERTVFETGEKMTIRIFFRVHKRVENPIFGLALFRDDGVHILGRSTKTSGYPIKSLEKGKGWVEYVIDNLNLLEGLYLLGVMAYDYSGTHAYDHQHFRYKFFVTKNIKGGSGLVHFGDQWDLKIIKGGK